MYLFALERFNKRGFFAADVRTSTSLNVNVKVVASAASVLAEVSLGVGLSHSVH